MSPTQETTNLLRFMVPAVNISAVRPVGNPPVPSPPPPQPLALSNGRAGVGAWLQALLFSMLAWAAVLCTGLGGSMGVASQTLANKLAASAQHVQRHGFAITMALGIVISMFTAVSVVKVMMLSIVRRQRLKTIQIRPLFGFRPLPDGTRFNFMKARFAGLGFSALLVLGSVLLLFKPGPNFGIDFRGGIQMDVATSTPDDLSRYRAQLDGLGLGEVSLQTLGNDGRLLVRVERQPGGEVQQTVAVERLKAALLEVDPQASFERTEVVGPSKR